MKIAFLTTYNSDFLKKEFGKYLEDKNYNCESWWNGYGLYEQTVFDKSSSLHAFNPDLIFIHYEVEYLLGDSFFDLLSLNPNSRNDLVSTGRNKLAAIINSLLESFPKSKIVIENFIQRQNSYLGILDYNIEAGLYQIIIKLNEWLYEYKLQVGARLIVNNYNQLITDVGRDLAFDMRMFRLGKFPFAKNFIPGLIAHYELPINILTASRKKCIVVDLDNTLWGGIVGQDGIDKIELGGSGIGESYVQFQKVLLNFYRKGIFLAVCSKNNYEDALEVFDKHPDMILRKEYFSSLKINWSDKASNLKLIANELNIGIDSLVFLDDNPAECELVKQRLPEVEVVRLTGDPDNYIKQLFSIQSLQTVSLTKEDLQRNQMKQADEKRKELETSFSNLGDFYQSLEMEAFINVNDETHISRVAQLTQKTNQFNLTTKRYSNEEIREFIQSNKYKVYTLRLIDKFGDNGIVLVAIVKIESQNWFIDTFLMSCRVIGRQAETALLNSIVEDALNQKAEFINGEFIPTKKNNPAVSFFSDHNFVNTKENYWELKLPAKLIQHHIKIIRNN